MHELALPLSRGQSAFRHLRKSAPVRLAECDKVFERDFLFADAERSHFPPAVRHILNNAIGGNSNDLPGASQLTVGPGGTVFGCSRLAGGAFALKPPHKTGSTWTLIHLPSSSPGVPGSELALDTRGNLYGMDGQTAFLLTPPATQGGTWTYSILHTFLGGSESNQPFGRPMVDASGRVFGSTLAGGTGTCRNYLPLLPGCGTVFELQ